MKLSLLLSLCLMAASVFGQVAVPAQEVAAARAYDPRAIASSAQPLQGKLIKLQFVTRSSITEKTADGGLTGEVVNAPGTRIIVNVAVPKEAVDWFMNLPTTYKGGPGFTVYARLATDRFGAPVARLLGRQYRSDAAGSRIEW